MGLFTNYMYLKNKQNVKAVGKIFKRPSKDTVIVPNI